MCSLGKFSIRSIANDICSYSLIFMIDILLIASIPGKKIEKKFHQAKKISILIGMIFINNHQEVLFSTVMVNKGQLESISLLLLKKYASPCLLTH